ncbi:MAG: hypothetical protein NC548_37005 [Lachnospiraceae bacterium]|nr:hypothetical protein [Lachnospiraceae bacterium]
MSEEKKIISRILTERREWFNVSDKLPKDGELVVIRITNESMQFGTTHDGNIIAAEDSKIGTYMNGSWIIAPPYPKFDYSPLSNGPFLNDGSVVTHWAVPVPNSDKDIGEVEAWQSRFEVIGKYNKFAIEIDKEHEELLYRACSWGAACIRKVVDAEEEDIKKIIEILYDVQNLLDQDAEIRDGVLTKICGDEKEAIRHIKKAKEALEEDSSTKPTLRDMFLIGMFGDKPIEVYRVNEESSDGPAVTKLAEGKNLMEVLNENKDLADFLYLSATDSPTVRILYVKENK